MSRVLACHHASPHGRANRRDRKGPFEDKPLSSQFVDPRRLEFLTAHVSDFVVPEFVGHDVDDVRQRLRASRLTRDDREESERRHADGDGDLGLDHSARLTREWDPDALNLDTLSQDCTR